MKLTHLTEIKNFTTEDYDNIAKHAAENPSTETFISTEHKPPRSWIYTKTTPFRKLDNTPGVFFASLLGQRNDNQVFFSNIILTQKQLNSLPGPNTQTKLDALNIAVQLNQENNLPTTTRNTITKARSLFNSFLNNLCSCSNQYHSKCQIHKQ